MAGKSSKTKKITIFVLSAIASTIIGVYVLKIFEKKVEIDIKIWESEIVDKSASYSKYKRTFYILNDGDLPLKNLTVYVSVQSGAVQTLGTPKIAHVIKNECAVTNLTRHTATWECNYLNPRESIGLVLVNGVGRGREYLVGIRAEGYNNSFFIKPEKPKY